MRTKHYVTLFIILLNLSTNLKAQTQENKPKVLQYDHALSAELTYQGSFGLALGGIIGKNLGEKLKPNYSLGIYSDFILGDELIFAPRLKLNWNYASYMGIGVNFANNYRSGANDFRITPEVNISLNGIANIFFGYSFNTNKNAFDDLSEFRIGMNLNFINK